MPVEVFYQTFDGTGTEELVLHQFRPST